jgi:hypothetical protein
MPLPKPPAKRAALLRPPTSSRRPRPRRPTRAATRAPIAADRRRRRWTSHAGRPRLRAGRAGGACVRRAPTRRRGRPAAARPAQAPRPRKPRGTGPAKLFVLDTNVLMHDPMSLFRFEEHDVFLPMITLEELDGHKKGMSEVARNVRQVSRDLDALAASTGGARPAAGIPLAKTGHREAGGKLFFQTMLLDVQAARRPAAGQGRQPDPGRGAEPARAAPGARGGAGVQGHQHARQGARAGPAGRGLLQRQDAGRRRPALHRRAAAAGRLLGAPWQDHGELAAGRPHLLPHQRAAGAGADDQPVRLPRGPGAAPLYARSPRSPARPRC